MARKPRRILVVEDDAEVAAVLREILHRNGYHVLTARSGVEAIVALTSPAPELPDAILLDIGLPLSSGVTVLDFVRNIMSSRLPVIVLTASANAEQEQELRKLGISRYLRKPASLEQVLSAISEALTTRKRH
jgi:chemosensory pili system protein ChpA (sensor histidine kinase/response regulator)